MVKLVKHIDDKIFNYDWLQANLLKFVTMVTNV
jgi:hypothetical protein